FEVSVLPRAEAETHIANRNMSAIVTIPANFSAGVRAQINQTIYTTVSTALVKAILSGNYTGNGSGGSGFGNYTMPTLEANVTATVIVEGDFTYSEFATSQAYVQGFVTGFVDGVT